MWFAGANFGFRRRGVVGFKVPHAGELVVEIDDGVRGKHGESSLKLKCDADRLYGRTIVNLGPTRVPNGSSNRERLRLREAIPQILCSNLRRLRHE